MNLMLKDSQELAQHFTTLAIQNGLISCDPSDPQKAAESVIAFYKTAVQLLSAPDKG